MIPKELMKKSDVYLDVKKVLKILTSLEVVQQVDYWSVILLPSLK